MSDEILLSHGSGGRLSRELIETEILSRFGDGPLVGLPDAALLEATDKKLVFSTDSFVVQPLVFPGGNIGHLAVHGTVNDIAVSGGVPRWLSLGLILEEGLSLEVFRLVLDAVKSAAEDCGITVVTGDTKVVQRGQCDGMYINTAGIGEAIPGFELSPGRISSGDKVVVSGTLGDHGMAVMSAREQLEFQNSPESDTAPVHRLVSALGDIASSIKVMRDPTRGGASAVLNELVLGQSTEITLVEKDIPFRGSVRAAAEMLGFDLLHVASEGRVIAVCEEAVSEVVVEKWKKFPEGQDAAIIGAVSEGSARVILDTLSGGKRLVDVPEGELLPRIC